MRARRGAPAAATPGAARAGRAALCLISGLILGVPLPSPAGAQPVTERTPNLEGTWITSPRNLHFQFAHRFRVFGEDANVTDLFSAARIENYPTFDFGYGLFRDAMLGVSYSTNSRTAGGGNEWQPFLKVRPLRTTDDRPWSLALTAAYNGASRSLDGELAADVRADPFIVMGALRGFTSGLDGLETGAPDGSEVVAVAGGLGLRVNRYVTLAADLADVVSGPEGDPAWSAGVQIGIPYTPHTLSLQATNVYSGTLQGTSVGGDEVFWGFEFTVPFSGFARWGEIISPGESGAGDTPGEPDRGEAGANGAADEPAEGEAGEDAAEDAVVEVRISAFVFETDEIRVPAGTTVRWVNADPVAHTATSDEDAWDSGLIGPGETYERTFTDTGRFPYHCTPHPFMTGTVVVTDSDSP